MLILINIKRLKIEETILQGLQSNKQTLTFYAHSQTKTTYKSHWNDKTYVKLFDLYDLFVSSEWVK